MSSRRTSGYGSSQIGSGRRGGSGGGGVGGASPGGGGLFPRGVRAPVAGGLGRRGHGRYLLWAARSVAQRVQAPVRGDPVEPRAHRGSVLEGLEPPPSRQQRLLNEVLGVLNGAEDPVAVDLQLPPVGIGELSKRILVTRPGHGHYH